MTSDDGSRANGTSMQPPSRAARIWVCALSGAAAAALTGGLTISLWAKTFDLFSCGSCAGVLVCAAVGTLIGASADLSSSRAGWLAALFGGVSGMAAGPIGGRMLLELMVRIGGAGQ